MKHAYVFALCLIALTAVILSTPVAAQFTRDAEVEWVGDNDGGKLIKFEGALDSLGELYSKAFTLAEFDAESWSTYPVAVVKKMTSVSGLPRVSIIIQGSMGDANNYMNVDTLATADSVETANYTTLDLNGKKFSHLRARVFGAAGNRADTEFMFRFYVYRRETE